MNILLNQRNYNDFNDVSVDFASLGSPVRRPKRLALSSVCNVSQAMTNVNSAQRNVSSLY